MDKEDECCMKEVNKEEECKYDYGDREYWDERYSTLQGRYEWYSVDMWDLEATLEPIKKAMATLRRRASSQRVRCLELGCGTSSIGPQLASLEGFDVVCVDYSYVVIELMKSKFGETSFLSWVWADATELAALYADSSFDLIIDKGCLDAMCCKRDHRMRQYVLEMRRLLRQDMGVGILVSHGANRLPYLNPAFEVERLEIISEEHSEERTWCYLLKRRTELQYEEDQEDNAGQPVDFAACDSEEIVESAFGSNGTQVFKNDAFNPCE